ncbi:MAG TPA: hypothetical protein VI489_02420 [Candidatus Brocadiaceae bacterium]
MFYTVSVIVKETFLNMHVYVIKEIKMMSKEVMAGGAVLVGVLIAATQYMGWSGTLNYLWAALVLIWGIVEFTQH